MYEKVKSPFGHVVYKGEHDLSPAFDKCYLPTFRLKAAWLVRVYLEGFCKLWLDAQGKNPSIHIRLS